MEITTSMLITLVSLEKSARTSIVAQGDREGYIVTGLFVSLIPLLNTVLAIMIIVEHYKKKKDESTR